MSDSTVGQTKQFGKGQRTVPAQKAQKWYPVDDESQPKKVSNPRATRDLVLDILRDLHFLWMNAMLAPVIREPRNPFLVLKPGIAGEHVLIRGDRIIYMITQMGLGIQGENVIETMF